MTDSQSGPNTPETEVVDLLAGAHASVGEGHAPRFGRDRRVGRGGPIIIFESVTRYILLQLLFLHLYNHHSHL